MKKTEFEYTLKLGVVSLSLPTEYPQLPAVLIGTHMPYIQNTYEVICVSQTL